MGKTLVIAEKPSVARDIAKVLGVTEKADGCLMNERYVVSWAIGHLVTLAEPEHYGAEYKKWSFDTLPILPEKMELTAISKTKSQLRILHKWMHSREIDDIICATDSGREGELIFRYIYDITKCKKPFRRLWISSMTEKAIREGFAHLKDGKEYDLLYRSAKCRSEADWLVGMNASRAYTLQYQALLSIGRVQTPTLALIVKKQKEIDAFCPEDYYEVQADFDKYVGLWIDERENTRLKEKKKAEKIAAFVQGKPGYIEKMQKEERKQPPPLLYDLTELQRECNRKFGFSAKKTLDIAQGLYEKRKMITYPRTDSRYLSDDMKEKARKTLQKLANAEEFAPFAKTILSMEKISFSKRIIDNSKVTDHHAIMPTDARIHTDHLTEDERKVFRLVAGRFLSVFYPYYVYETTKIYTIVEGERFLSKGTVVLQEGWQAVERVFAPKAKKGEKEEEQVLPPLAEGQRTEAMAAKVLQKKTKPPSLYTESSLLSAMENAGRLVEDEALREEMKDSGLGTPATRAAIIERLLKVGYIQRKGKTLLPTEKGKNLIAVVPEELCSPQTTGKWEKGLSSIAKGKMTEERFMGSIRRYVQFLVADAAKEKKDVSFAREPMGKTRGKRRRTGLGQCPLCKRGSVLENSKAYFCTEWKNGCKFTIWKNSTEAYGIVLDEKTVKKLIKEEKIEKISAVLPQTGERVQTDLVLCADHSGRVELRNVTREKKE